MKQALLGRRVLFIAPRFFGYEQDIAGELRLRGAEVDMLPDRPFDTPFMHAVTRFARGWILPAVDRHHWNELERLGRTTYDLVLVINGQTLSQRFLRGLRSAFPAATFVLYIWDSVENRSSVITNITYFDDCSSFDQGAAAAFGLRFRPLFFSRGFEQPPSGDFSFHLSFVGTAHTDRFAVVTSVERHLGPGVRLFWYLYLQAPWVFFAYKLTNPDFRAARIDRFRFRPLPRSKVQDILFRSAAVLDIEHPKQTGLTMRTLETLGASRKLVTTNGRVRDYDFFSPSNIHVIDRYQAVVPEDFIRSPYETVPAEVYQKYRLEGWMDDILAGSTG